MKKANEMHALSTALALLSHIGILDHEPSELSFPDEENSDSEDVDCLVRDGTRQFALEHSILEFYPGQLDYLNTTYELMKQVNLNPSGKLSQDWHYTLLIDPDLITRKRKKHFDRLVSAVVKELNENVSLIKPGLDHSFDINGLPITVYCESIEGLLNGSVYRAPISPSVGIELKMMKRVKDLLDSKLPKLIRYKFEGRKTVLLVEDISGRFMTKIDKNLIGFWNRIRLRLFVDMVVIFVSNAERMVVANLWKNGGSWPEYTPIERRYSVIDLENSSSKAIKLT